MSADNWTTCPRCENRAIKERNRLVKQVEESYGKVPSKEYLALLKQSESPIKLEDTLREDYELGRSIDDNFFVSYHASCEECGFQYSYRHRENMNVGE